MIKITVNDDDFRLDRVLEEYTGCGWEHGFNDYYFKDEDAVKIWEDIKPLRDFIDDLSKAIAKVG